MLGTTEQISCICRGRDCHFCVYNLGPGTVSFCAPLILKRSVLQNRPFIWFTRRPVRSCSGKANAWSHSASQGRMHGGEIKLDMWRRTKGSQGCSSKVKQLNALATGWRREGKDLKTKRWLSEGLRVTKHWWNLKDGGPAFCFWPVGLLYPRMLCRRQAPRRVMGECDNRLGCGLAWIVTV